MALTQNENQFLALLEDCISQKYHTEKIIGFLDEKQKRTASEYFAKRKFLNYSFFGGYDDADRVLLLVFPHEWRIWDSPVGCVTISYKGEETLSHRDILGSVLSLGIQRDLIGDILTEDSRAVVFAYPHAAQLIVNELERIGKTHVCVKEGFEEPLPVKNTFVDMTVNVASMRIDCIVSALSGLSREKGAELIRRGLVKCDYVTVEQSDMLINKKVIISIRGYGKFIVSNEISTTRRGRLSIKVKKYA